MTNLSKKKLTRRSLMAGAAGVSLVGTFGSSPAIAQAKRKVKMAGINILAFAPMFVAKELGYFEQEGLDAEIIETKGGSQTTAAMLGGSAEVISTGYASPVILAGQGKSVKSIVGLEMASNYAFILKSDLTVPLDDIKALVAALKGKKLGVATLGSGADTVGSGVLAEAGAAPDHVVKVAVGTGGTAVAALKAGGIDALVAFEPDIVQIVKSGVGKIALDLRSTKSGTAYAALPILLQN